MNYHCHVADAKLNFAIVMLGVLMLIIMVPWYDTHKL
jgi:hypothetical protein